MAILIAFVFVLLVILLRFEDIRLRVFAAMVASSVLMVALTEILGALRLLTGSNLALGWAAFVLVLLAINFKLRRFQDIRWQRHFWRFDILETLIIAAMTGLALLLGIIAVVAAPNNWDSMAYHLPRVMQWMQNR